MKTDETIQTIATTQTIEIRALDQVTGGCAACGNPAHGQQLAQQAARWGARLGQRLGGLLRR